MRPAIVVAVLLACAPEDCPPKLSDAVAGMYAITQEGVTCIDPLTRTDEPGRVLCQWHCTMVGGRLAHDLFLDFTNVPDWHLDTISIEYSRTEDCFTH